MQESQIDELENTLYSIYQLSRLKNFKFIEFLLLHIDHIYVYHIIYIKSFFCQLTWICRAYPLLAYCSIVGHFECVTQMLICRFWPWMNNVCFLGLVDPTPQSADHFDKQLPSGWVSCPEAVKIVEVHKEKHLRMLHSNAADYEMLFRSRAMHWYWFTFALGQTWLYISYK